MPHTFDHATPGDNLLIYNMVRNRLPFILDIVANQTILSNFTWEIMNQLEICFRIAEKVAPDNVVGQEGNYTALQQSIIADLVAVYVILMQAAGGWDFTTGLPATTGSAASTTTFLKKAKAGSVEVEYDQFDAGKGAGTTAIGNTSLLNFYKKNAINKAGQSGCIIDICDDCSLNVMNINMPTINPFIIVNACGCG